MEFVIDAARPLLVTYGSNLVRNTTKITGLVI
jgi:hypothetical protein